MEALRFARFRVAYKPVERATLPREKGRMFRRGFVASMRQAGCPMDAPPFPFVFNPPGDDREKIFAGDTLLMSLTLIGGAIDHIERYIEGLGQHARRLRMSLEQMEMLDPRDGKYSSFYFGKEQTIKTRIVPYEWKHALERAALLQRLDLQQITLKFLQPLRMRPQDPLLPALLDRLQTLGQRYCDGSPQHAALPDVTIEPALHWLEHPRHLPQASGSVVLRGPLHALMPLLVVGMHLHVGAAAAFGFGRYELAR